MQSKFPYEPWSVTEEGFRPADLAENESVFALGNGFIGLRGNLEEGGASGAVTIPGSYLNGVFDSEPIRYGETAYGYAKNHETICSVMDAKGLLLSADGERLDAGACELREHRRVLDMRSGLLRRSFRWQTRSGCLLEAETERLVCLARPELAAARLRLRCLSGSCRLTLESGILPAVITEGDPNDPRNAAGKDRSLIPIRPEAEGALLLMGQRTKNSGFSVCCAVEHRGGLPFRTEAEPERVRWLAETELSEGGELLLEKSICYVAERYGEEEALRERARSLCLGAPGFEALAAEQRAFLDAFWENAWLEIRGDDALLQGLRFNLFHLLQAAGRDGKTNIAAKGLTGEGYEGHTFWDTESYILPVFLHTDPALARKLLEYRHAMLPKARERARIMGHAQGALFPWRTIDGEECSAYYPAGSAQYHIDGDIAHAVRAYYDATEDLDFLARFGAELLAECARLYWDLGFFSQEKGGRFVINCVTGPDEYNVLVDNNVYTNRVAEESFRAAAAALRLLRQEAPEDWRRVCDQLALRPEEPEDWLRAAEAMYYPPARDGIYPQDDGFLDREPWPPESIPAGQKPLLLHFHPMTIYRRRICKQADLILAMLRFGERYTLEDKKRNFAFYDSVTTHDSSLSMAVFSILASEIGETDKAYDYFMSSARLDLDDIHRNTKDGLHMANMAGTWLGLAQGFGGMRCSGGRLSFAPVCPERWEGYSFRAAYRGRLIQADVSKDGARYTLLRGEPITIRSFGEELELKK